MQVANIDQDSNVRSVIQNNTIHILANGKGGIGKSFVAWNLAEFLFDKYGPFYGADTDPTNNTFASYKGLSAKHIKIVDDHMNVNKKKFDELIEDMLNFTGQCVIDNGGSSFVPMMAYLKQAKVIEMLQRMGRKVLIHTPLIAGRPMDDTLRGLQAILDFTVATVLVWENERDGPIIRNGVRFVDSALFNDNTNRLRGSIRIHERDPDTFGDDLKLLTSRSMTYREMLDSEEFMTMAKQRMMMMREDIFLQLEGIGL